MGSVEEQIRRKGLDLGFSNVGFTDVRDYPEYLEEARSRPNYDIFAGADDSLITRLSTTKTLNPWAAAHLPALHEAKARTDNPDVLKAIDWAIDRLETAK